MTTELIPLSNINRDGGTQSRAGMNAEAIAEYRDALVEARGQECATAKGWPFPPVTVYYDGTHYHLSDGYHRTIAAAAEGWFQIPCDVRQGTRRDAVLASVAANADHGLRRNQADKRRAIETLLRDDEWGQWSDREIARRTNTSHPTVAVIRAEVEKLTGKFTSERRYTDRHGNETTMQMAQPKVDSTDYAIAYDWLGVYQDEKGRRWFDLEANQIMHANSPCYQAFVAKFPDIANPKQYLKDSLARLQRLPGGRFTPAADPPPMAQPATPARWIDTQEPLRPNDYNGYLVGKIRLILHAEALRVRPAAPLSIVEEWAATGPNHERWPEFGFHPTTPNRDRTIAAQIRSLLAHGIIGTGNVATVDGWAFCAASSSESVIASLADESNSLHNLRIDQYGRDTDMTAAEIRAAARAIQEARGWGKSQVGNLMADRLAATPPAVGRLILRNDDGETIERDLVPAPPAPDMDPIATRGQTYTDKHGTTYHRRTITNDHGQVEHSWQPDANPFLDELMALNSRITRLAAETNVRDVGIGVISALAAASVKLDAALAAYRQNRGIQEAA